MAEEDTASTNSYRKRPLWQWVLLYAVVAIILYGAFYYFVLSKNGSGYNSNQNYQPTSTQSASTSSSEILTTKTDSSKGQYLADSKGMTVYIYDNDTQGVSNCYGSCATVWPPYISSTSDTSNFPANVTLVKRTDGTMIYAYKGMPLYYYASDSKPGDTMGDGVGGIWHLVKP